jgi:hypothetical protein
MKETGDEKSRDNVPFNNKFSSDISVAPYTVGPPTKFRGFPTGMSSPAASQDYCSLQFEFISEFEDISDMTFDYDSSS